MKKYRNLILILTLVVLLVAAAGSAEIYKEKPKVVEKLFIINNITSQAQQMQLLLQQKKAEGFNVSEAEELDSLSRKAAERGDFKESLRLINEAKFLLEKMEKKPMKQTMVELHVNSSKVLVTNAVPSIASGKDIKDFRSAFISKTIDVKDGKISLELSDIPIFIEEVSEIEQSITYNDETSAFGIHEPPFRNYDFRLDDLGIRWVRLSGPSGVVWDADEPEKGKYDWSRITDIISLFNKHKINMVVTVLCFNKWDQGGIEKVKEGPLKDFNVVIKKLPKDIEKYQSFLKKVVEKFDGDGIDDAPGSPIVKYWQIENELDGFWRDTPRNYAFLVKTSYRAIKESDPSAKIVLGGIATPEGYNKFYVPMLDELDKMKKSNDERFFDVVDFHWSIETGGNYKATKGHTMKKFITNLRNKFDSLGYNDVSIWITEMSSYSGKPSAFPYKPDGFLRKRTETEHAADLIKSYVYPLGLGINKIFWLYGLSTLRNWGGLGINNYTDNVTLSHYSSNQDKLYEKLAYYSLKLIVDKLDGFSDITNLNIGENIYAYKFSRGKKFVYVLWRE